MESAFRLPASAPQGTREYAHRYTSDEWEIIKPKIEQFYVQEKKTLQQVIHILEQQYGFTASEKQLKSMITKWGFDVKNVKGDIMVQMARARVRRKRLTGKDSVFRVSKRPVAERNINRYLKRNNVSEEDLLSIPSPFDPPSPAFSVFTPRLESPSDVYLQGALSAGDTVTPLNEFVALDVDSNLGAPNPNSVSDDSAYLRHQQLLDSNGHTSQALTISRLQRRDFSGELVSKTLHRSIQDRPDSPEMLFLLFRAYICPMLSITHGENNMWQTLVLPLVHNSQSLYHAITAMTALHISTDKRLRIHGTSSWCRALRNLQYEIEGEFGIPTLATILILAFWARWEQGFHMGKLHVDGAIASLRVVWSQSLEMFLRPSPNPLLVFLSDSCWYLDSVSRLVHATTAIHGYRVSEMAPFGKSYGDYLAPASYTVDPWMCCAGSLFPLMTRAADLCYAVRKATRNSLGIIREAVALRFELERWIPRTHLCFPCSGHTFEMDTQYLMHTVEAYRHATILYLQQAVPEILGTNIKLLALDTIRHLSSMPHNSTLSFVHIYPLFVAGCEASNKEERQWVKERWTVMMARMRVTNVSKCWEITQEVWKRRDAYRQQKSEISTDYHQEPGVECMRDDLEESGPEFMVGGGLHWATIMTDLGWEVSF